jgi:hypothetical protein
MPIYPKPFQCQQCEQYPDKAFHIFQPTQDWIMTFPEQRLFHVHFGDVAFPEIVDRAQAVDAANYYYHRIHEYPDRKFFYVVDMTQIDNSALISDRAKQIYQILLQHPQLSSGVVYGATTDMQAIIRLCSEAVEKPVQLVRTKAEADILYSAWTQTQSRIPGQSAHTS